MPAVALFSHIQCRSWVTLLYWRQICYNAIQM